MVEISDAVLEALAGPVAAAIPLVVARTPKGPAAELGRLRATDDGKWPMGSAAGHGAAARFHSGGRPGAADSPVRDALGSLPPLLIERLLGALELTLPELDLAGTPDLTDHLGEPFTGNIGVVTMDGTSGH